MTVRSNSCAPGVKLTSRAANLPARPELGLTVCGRSGCERRVSKPAQRGSFAVNHAPFFHGLSDKTTPEDVSAHTCRQ
jgi:hypothetical protein